VGKEAINRGVRIPNKVEATGLQLLQAGNAVSNWGDVFLEAIVRGSVPTRPEESILTVSTPPSAKAIVSAVGKNIPVFVSPVAVNEGAPADPAPSRVFAAVNSDAALPSISWDLV
jgi:hypothetical protein